jgi:hypothetical protein
MQLSSASHQLWFKLALFFTASFLAVIFGMIAITNNPILIGLAVGMILGLFLLASPKISIWLVIVLGLGTPALLDMAGHGLSKMLWAISMLGLLLWVPGVMHLFSLNPQHKKITPLYIWIAILFAVFALASTALQLHSFSELFGGFKRYFQGFGLMLVLATMPWAKADFDRWLKALLAIALLQLPFALFERFILVPLRGGIEAAGGEATDVVAGTMGANLQGGSPNAIMVFFVLLALTFVIARWKEQLLSTGKTWWLGLLLLLPLTLGETKIVIVLLPMIAVLLFMKDIQREPSKFIPVLLLLLLLTFGLAYMYVYLMLESTFIEAVEGMVKYNIQEMGYGNLLLNRTTVLTFWAGLHDGYNPIAFLFGHGLGSSYGAGFDAGHMAQLYPKYGINLTTISTLLWDLGVVGLALYLSILAVAWLQMGRIEKHTTDPQMRADSLSIRVGIALCVVFLMYSDSQINLIVHEIIIAVMLGYGAFLYRQHQTSQIQTRNMSPQMQL